MTALLRLVRLKVAWPLAVSHRVKFVDVAVGALVRVRLKLPDAVPGQPDPSEIPVKVREPVPVRKVGMFTVFVDAL
jgi:hypothetical protein